MKNCCLCEELHTLLEEQETLSKLHSTFQFVCALKKLDTIPFMLQTAGEHTPFAAILNRGSTPYFRLEELISNCCARLRLLKPIDMIGQQTLHMNDLFALRKTDHCIIVNICCFCAITPLSPELLIRPLPIVESKS
ncbi:MULTISPECIES: CotY/CotZ family spore coat protein [Sporosarcina]|uniref:CotY/CotZ family spore coat protein n=1 Tax=Sporosarcina contaminans TaxID=633403 RepID=A0ABW3TU54_9BACL